MVGVKQSKFCDINILYKQKLTFQLCNYYYYYSYIFIFSTISKFNDYKKKCFKNNKNKCKYII